MVTAPERRAALFPRAVLAVAIGVALLSMSACGTAMEPRSKVRSTPTPVPTPTQTSVTPTSTPTGTPLPTSTSATVGSVEEQLRTATIDFYAAVTQAYATLDPAPIQAVIVPGSRAGSFYLEDIATVKQKAHKFADPPEYTVADFQRGSRDNGSTNQTVAFTLTADYSEEVTVAGKLVEKFPAGSAEGRIEFTKSNGKWLVRSQTFDD